MYSDASGSWGAGALWGKEWFHFQWPASWADVHISPKEMAPIVVAVAIWGSNWAGERVCCFSDNMAVVYAINKGAAKDPQLSRLLRLLFFFTAAHEVTIVARHVPGEDNTLADALSRNKLPLFHSLYPQAHRQQAAVPHPLQELVLGQELRWTSPVWIERFSATLKSVSPRPREHPMPPLTDGTSHFAPTCQAANPSL